MARITGSLWIAGILLACAGATEAQTGVPGNSLSPSADGRYVAFASEATGLVPGDTNGVNDVFVYEVQNQKITRVSVSNGGNQANRATPLPKPAISGDGRFVAFVSSATNLVTGDSNNVGDVFVHDRQTGATTRVSVSSSGGQVNGASSDPAISADGRYVAFVSNASNMVAGDTNGDSDVFVHDRQTGATTRVSVDSTGKQGNAQSEAPSLSAEGRYVAFASRASNLVSGDTNGTLDVFVHDRQTGATTRVSVGSSRMQGNNSSREPSLSADGRYVAFTSQADNLVTGDTNIKADVFVYDRQTAQTTRVSMDGAGNQLDSDSDSPSISGDGRFVAFLQRDFFSFTLVAVHDRQMQATNEVDHGSTRERPSISADGRFVVYDEAPVVAFITAVPRIVVRVFSDGQPGPGKTQFHAGVVGTDDKSVTWSIHPAVGIITGQGLYTAPASVETPLVVTVNARSVVENTRSGAYWLPLGGEFGFPLYTNTFTSPFLFRFFGGDDCCVGSPWTVIDEGTSEGPSNWKNVDGILTQTSNIYGGALDVFSLDKPGTYALVPFGSEWTNYTISARLRSTDDDAIGIMFGYRDADNYYRFSMDRERKYRRLVKVVNGVFTVLAQDDVAYEKGRWYNAQVTLARGIIRILLDGQELFNVRDISHDRGSIAFYTWNNSGAEFDDLAVIPRTTLGCTYSFQPRSVDVSAQGAAGAVNVATQDGCPWTATSNATWITIVDSDNAGSGSATMRYQVAANTSSTARERTISLGSGAAFTVRQAGASGGNGLPFGDDFMAGQWPGPWTVVDEGATNAPSHWYVQNGILNQNSNIFGGDATALATPGTYALIGRTTWTNYNVAVKIKSTDDDGIGLMFGYKDRNNYYRFSMDRQQTYRRLVKVVNGVFTKLAEDAVAYTQNQWYTVEATMMNGRIKIIFNGQTLFTVNDASHTAGKVALYSWNNTGAQFDDFAVSAAAGTISHCVSDAGGLHAALLEAAFNGQNDVIRLVKGQYNGSFIYSPTEPLDLAILGGYSANCSSRVVDPANTVIDGGSPGAVFQLTTDRSVDFAMEGVTLLNGGSGGLVAKTSGGITLTRNALSHNSGGGASIQASSITMRDNIVEGNDFGNDGALHLDASTVIVTGNIVRNNRATGFSAGIEVVNDSTRVCTTATLTGNVIEDNQGIEEDEAIPASGGVYCVCNKSDVQNNVIRRNKADAYGAAYFAGTEITFVNNVVTDNASSVYGFTIELAETEVHVVNNTIAGNYGWGLVVGSQGHAYIYNNIFFSNGCYYDCSDLQVGGDGVVELFNNDFDRAAADVPRPIHSSNLNKVDPRFVDAPNGDYRLKPSSPVINKGANAAPKLPAKDIEGRARILLGTVDMGAYESTGASPVEPVNPSPPNGATGVALTPTLAWSPGLGATSYSVYFGTSSTPPLVTSTTGTTYAPGTLTANTKYYWRVVAKAGAKSTSSPVWSFTTGNPAPSEPLPTNGATGVVRTPTLRWTPSDLRFVSYDVYFGLTSPPPLVTNTTGTTFAPGTLSAAKKYYWKVVAKTSGGVAASSPIWSFTTK